MFSYHIPCNPNYPLIKITRENSLRIEILYFPTNERIDCNNNNAIRKKRKSWEETLEITSRSSIVLHASSHTRKGGFIRARHVVSDVSTRASLSLSASRINSNLNHSLPQDKGLLISRSERAALLFGTLRNRINTALTSRLRDYPNYSTWDLIQVCNQGKGEEKEY